MKKIIVLSESLLPSDHVSFPTFYSSSSGLYLLNLLSVERFTYTESNYFLTGCYLTQIMQRTYNLFVSIYFTHWTSSGTWCRTKYLLYCALTGADKSHLPGICDKHDGTKIPDRKLLLESGLVLPNKTNGVIIATKYLY